MDAPLLTVDGLSTRYRVEKRMLVVTEDISFDVLPGETVCLIGESGCGKTATLLSLIGLSGGDVTGSVRFDGRELTRLSLREWRKIRGREMSFIFQDPRGALNPVITVGQSVCELLLAHLRLDPAGARSRTIELFGRVGLPAPAQIFHRYPHQLSGGMRQRVLIAGALANSPRLILADEPTSSLDVTIRAQIAALFCDIKERQGCSFLIASHDLSLVRRLADRVVVMYAGRIAEQGPAGAVLDAPSHPYTRALLAAANSDAARPLTLLEGEPPSPFRYPDGCRFHPRCPFRSQKCVQQAPPEIATTHGSRIRCHMVHDGDR